jgi:hypothetical protein
MQPNPDCTSRTSSSSATTPSTVFTPAFLERIRRLQNPPSARQASLSGPWEVESVPTRENGRRFVVSRRAEPFSQGGSVFGVFPSRTAALATAAVLPSVGAPMGLHLNGNGHRLGHALHDGPEFLGHLARADERFLPRLHTVRCLLADPGALALLMEAAGPEALAILGRELHRRVEKAAE